MQIMYNNNRTTCSADLFLAVITRLGHCSAHSAQCSTAHGVGLTPSRLTDHCDQSDSNRDHHATSVSLSHSQTQTQCKAASYTHIHDGSYSPLPCQRCRADKKLSYRRETARQLHMTTWACQLTYGIAKIVLFCDIQTL